MTDDGNRYVIVKVPITGSATNLVTGVHTALLRDGYRGTQVVDVSEAVEYQQKRMFVNAWASWETAVDILGGHILEEEQP